MSPDDGTVSRLVHAYGAHQRRIVLLCLAILGDHDAAEDAAQETFLRARHRLGELTGDDLGRYLSVVARHVCLDELRRRRRTGREPWQAPGIEPADDPQVSATDRSVIEAVWTRLDTRDRAFFLYRFAGYTHREIALRFRMTVGSVRVELSRARRRARRLLEAGDGLVAVIAQRLVRRTERRRRVRALWRPLWAGSAGGAVVLASGAAVVVLGVASLLSALSDGTERGDAPPVTGGRLVSAVRTLPTLSGTEVVGLTSSSASGGAQTFYAAGYTAGCSAPRCATLHRSRDGGRSWERLAAVGYSGGSIVLVPGEPGDRVLYAAGPAGLQHSDDGGATFRLVAPVVGSAAAVRDRRGSQVVIGAVHRLVDYDAVAGTLSAGPALPAGVSIGDVAAADDEGHLLVATETASSRNAAGGAAVWRCDTERCSEVVWRPGAPLLHVAASSTGEGVAVAYSASEVLVISAGSGGVRSSGARRWGGDITAVAVSAATHGPSDATVVVAVTRAGGAGLLWVSANGGSVYRDAVAPAPLTSVLLTPDRRVVAAVGLPATDGLWGVRCSAADGARWGMAC